MAYKNKIAVIIPTKERKHELRRLLASFVSQRCLPDQIIIVDASADADTLLTEDYKMLSVTYIHGNYSITEARNIGISSLKESISLVCFLDDDVVMEEVAWEAMTDYWESAGVDIGGCSFFIANEIHHDKTYIRILKRLLTIKPKQYGKILPSGFNVSPYSPSETTINADWLSGGVTVWRRIVFDTNAFDEWFSGYGMYEDVDFSYRVGKKYKLVVNTGAKVKHLMDISKKGMNFQIGKKEVINRLYFVRKHQELSVNLSLWSGVGKIIKNLLIGLFFLNFKFIIRACGNVSGVINYILFKDKAFYLSSCAKVLLKESIFNRLLSGSIWAATGKIITIFFGFLCNIFLARLLDPESMGAYFLILSIVLFSAIFAQLGTNIAVVRFIAESMGTNRPARAAKAIYISLKIAVTGITLISFLFLSGGGHWLAVSAFNSKLMAGVIGIFTVWIAVIALQHLLSEIFRGFSRIDLSSIFGGILTNVLSFIFFVLIWLIYGNSNLHQVIVVSVISCGVSTICAFIFLFEIINKIKGKSRLEGKELFFVSIPLLFTNLVMFVISQIDIWIIGIFSHKEDVAIYGAASKLALLISVPILIVNAVVSPLIAELYAKGEKEKLEHTLRSTTTFASLPSFVFLVIYIVFGNNILGFAFGEIYREGSICLIILSFGQFFYVCSGSPGIVLMMTGFQKQIMAIIIICLVVCLFGSVIMIEYFGINGVAIATAGGLSLQATLLTFYVKKKTDILTPIKFTNLKL